MDFVATLASSSALFIGLSVVLGLLVGSFLNVVIHRLPIMMERELRAECADLAAEDARRIAPNAPPVTPETAPSASSSEDPVAVAVAAVDAPAGAPESAPAEPSEVEDAREVEVGSPESAGAIATSDNSSAEMPGAQASDAPPSETEEPPQESAYNLVVPRSACPKCHAPITALQNIPVVSWLALRGKCANCQAPISARYPIVELATGVLTGFVAWHFGFGIQAAAAIVFTWFLIALTMIDFDTKYLPDQLTYPLLWLGLLMSLTHPLWSADAAAVSPRDSILGAVFGYLSLWSVYWLFKLIMKKEGMGYGDFKLLAALGAWLGWQMLLPIILLSSLAGSVVGIAILIRKKLGKDTEMPFGPYLAAAGWIALVFGHELVNQYFALATFLASKL